MKVDNRKILIASTYFLILLLLNCKKEDSTAPPTVETKIDYSTKYSNVSSVVLNTPLKLSNIHPETFKIILINNKSYLITCFADLQDLRFDYLRSFSVDTVSGLLTENTSTLLGGYYEVGFPKSPIWYEDLNGDAIKDLFITDHGKENPSLMINGQFPGYTCKFLIGNSNGTFINSEVNDITTTKRFYHNSCVGDVDKDGKKDLIIQSFSTEEISLYLNKNSSLTKVMNIVPNNQTGSVFIGDVDNDNIEDIISAPYIDRGNNPSTYIQKINLNSGSSYIKNNISHVSPFGEGYGCYKVFSMKHPTKTSEKNLFYLTESGVNSQKIFRSKESNINEIEDITTLQTTIQLNGIRDFQIIDLNLDGMDDILFFVNPGISLNSRVWINKGNNTFENPTWEIDANLISHFIPLSVSKKTGRTKFLYYTNGSTPNSRVIDVYTRTN